MCFLSFLFVVSMVSASSLWLSKESVEGESDFIECYDITIDDFYNNFFKENNANNNIPIKLINDFEIDLILKKYDIITKANKSISLDEFDGIIVRKNFFLQTMMKSLSICLSSQ